MGLLSCLPWVLKIVLSGKVATAIHGQARSSVLTGNVVTAIHWQVDVYLDGVWALDGSLVREPKLVPRTSHKEDSGV